MTSEDLAVLTNEDVEEIFRIIQLANRRVRLPEMRASIARSLQHAFQAKGVAFFLGDREFKEIDNTSLVSAGVDLHYLGRWARYYCQYDPFQQETRSRGTVCKVDNILSYKRWVNLKIYNEFYRPQNIHYKLSIYLYSGAKVLGLIGLFRPKEREDFSGREMAKARVLAPHLATALENALLFSETDEVRTPLGGWEDKLPLFGFMVLDDGLRPIYWNPEAKELCGDLYGKQQPRVNLGAPGKPLIPSEILQDCLELKVLFRNNHPPVSLRRQRVINGEQGKRFYIVSSPLEHSFLEGPSLGFVVYFLHVSQIRKDGEEILREKYQLTKREIDIFRCVCQGLTNDEIGEHLYISRFTVETHLKNIFDKTKVKHRTALAGLLQFL